VQYAADLHRRDRSALERRQEHAPQRIAQRQPESALERFAGEFPVGLAAGSIRLELSRTDQIRQFFASFLSFICPSPKTATSASTARR